MLDSKDGTPESEPRGQLRRDLALVAMVCCIAILAAVVFVRILVGVWT